MKSILRTVCFSFITLAFLFSTAQAKDVAAKKIKVKKPYVFASIPGAKTAPVYMELSNVSKETITITQVHSPASIKAEVHGHVKNGKMMSMKYYPQLDLNPESVVDFKPHGYHIMLIGLNKALKPGENIQLSLTLNDGSSLTVIAPVVDMRKGMDGKHGEMKKGLQDKMQKKAHDMMEKGSHNMPQEMHH